MDEVVQPAIFDPLIKFISEVDISGKITFELPLTFSIDVESVKSYFHNDACINFERGRPFNIFCGTLRDVDLAQYLFDKWQEIFHYRIS
jgi:hypothetical protein